MAAQWHAKTQIRHTWPHWTADAGRFASTVNIADPTERIGYSICWNTARGVQALLSAYLLSKNPEDLKTAQLGMEFVKSCQIFEPEFPHHAGACKEENAQTDHIASRDTVEAVQGFTNLYAVTKDPVALLRAKAGADWLTGWFLEKGYPNGYIWHKYQDDKGSVCDDFSRLMLSAAVLVLAQLDALTGEKRYTRHIPTFMDWVIEKSLEKDGALKIHDGTDVSHHAVKAGPLAGCFTNDDGAGVAMIAAWRATGSERYRVSALRNGEWWLKLPSLPETYASIPSALNTLLDLYRLSGDQRYLDKSLPYLEKVLSMQHLDPSDERTHGGFCGQDLSSGRESKIHTSTNGMDYISHRTTLYAMMALAKAACVAENQWNLAYSGFGW
ncbi:MAG: hypothetical protein A2293_01575 [Elusimicrobia bacterium RIFOXYB2_FULL_49_7]|nr:MAG: hypothetical protein A2293_01575 [Elusimicrobia bacterium RIFOXYB2_FULL_49_7]